MGHGRPDNCFEDKALLTPRAATMAFLFGASVTNVAVYYGMKGEDLKDGPIDFWLDRCWWGKYERLKNLRPYDTVEAESQGYFELFYSPQIVAEWDDTILSRSFDDLELTIYLPGYEPGKSALYFSDQINLPNPGTLTARPLPEPELVDEKASVYRLELPSLKVKDRSAVSITFRYYPNEKEMPQLMVELTKTFKDD